MIARRLAALAVLIFSAELVVSAAVTAVPASTPREVEPSAFRAVVVQPVRPSLAPLGPPGRERPSDPVRATVPVLSAEPATQDPGDRTPAPQRTPDGRSSKFSHRVAGTPTWYCNQRDPDYVKSRCTRGYPDVGGTQLYAAAGPSLRVGAWRGRVVSVTANGRTIRVKLVDYCACGGDHFLDLYLDAWKALGGPSRAVVKW